MKNSKGILTGFVATLWMFMGTDVTGQGSLTPPGAPGETMKTLAQVEPRTPISSLPYTISEPGSYYVTGNLNSTTNGIVIHSSGVTVDLMGFSLTGDGGYWDTAIYISTLSIYDANGPTNAIINNVVIKGGAINGFYNGVLFRDVSNSRMERLTVSDMTKDGFTLTGQCDGNTIVNCNIRGNEDGIELWSTGSFDSGGRLNGNSIVNCNISGNSSAGVYLKGYAGGECKGNTVADCTISGNGSHGIITDNSEKNLILMNNCAGNGINFSLDSDDIFVAVDAGTQDDPRTRISSLPYTISESGSYYVTGNLSSTEDGIVIESSGVTVDLMGFSITGDGSPEDYGIHVDGSTNAVIENLVIKGGRISGFDDGLYCEYMNNSRIEQMVVSGNTYDGVSLDGRDGQCNGNTIAACTISGNGDDGFYLSGFSGQCNGNTIADCTINDNGDLGVYLYGGTAGQCNGNTITDCTISENGDYGVYLRGDAGQCNGNTIQDNRISKNTFRGINLWTADGNRVEANNVWGTTGATSYGIRTGGSGTDNFILKNTCAGQTDNFYLDYADTYGPEVTSSGALSSTGAASHPWANFSR